MIISLALLLLAIGSGTLVSYLYDEEASLPARLCSGACVGIAALGLVCFIFSSFLGLTLVSILLTAVVLLLSLLTLHDANRRQFIQKQIAGTYDSLRQTLAHPRLTQLGYPIFYAFTAVVLWRCFDRAMLELPDGIYTAVLNNFGDLPFHISVITGFAYGNNFPPEDPTYAGVKFTYPFLTDFVSAIFVRCGATLRQSMFIENFVVALAFVGLLHRWAWVMLRDRLAAILTPLIVILNGGFGFVLLFAAARENHDTFTAFLKSLPASFTVIPDSTWRWGNSVSTLLIPQRGFLLGLPLAVIVFTLWWLATSRQETNAPEPAVKRKEKKRRTQKAGEGTARALHITATQRMIAAGVIAGLLPLVHAHSFVAIMGVGVIIALLQRRWREWFAFFVVASIIALPQMFWSTHGSAVNASKFFEWEVGWDHGTDNPVWFWLKNTGLFIPLTIVALLWRETKPLVSRPLLIFCLPFALCFIVPNILKMAPWIWDNIKVLYYWWVGFSPLVALLLARLWRRNASTKVVAVVLFICLIAAGALDVASILFRPTRHNIFDATGIAFSERIKSQTPPRSLIMHAPVHTHPVFLTGRRSLMGYPGHIWTHGLDHSQRENEVRRVYAGSPDAVPILRRYGVSYLVVGPHERRLMNVNDMFFNRFQMVGETGEYRLYKVAP